ncbi:ABC transporter ATP-binding protein [Bacillus sp. FJAT-49705]|uniref:ABC transporter ATP-binding protein n=2 Tax=Cytobacillus citreus TaxID=2833586 RepID=A0ABS5NZ58_9BACI|nr:ABC transporter ATP-binding protein [Cytobacillus citreus]
MRKERFSILRRVGSLVETPSYYGNLTGSENLEIVRRVLGVDKKNIEEVLKLVQLQKVKDRVVKEYSLGMKQRLGIAMALIGNPDLLILDEPTNGLDPAGIQEIRELIKQLSREREMTVLISSHLLSEIDQMATEVGIINQGQLIFQDKMSVLNEERQSSILIRVNELVKARKLLSKEGIVVDINEGQQTLSCEKCKDQFIAYINDILVRNNISVYRIEEKKKSLEDIFLQFTRSKSNDTHSNTIY